MQARDKARLLCKVIVIGLLVALTYHAILGYGFGVGYPGNSILYNPAMRFSDFYWIFEPVQAGSPLSGKMSLYFPFSYAPLFLLKNLSWQAAYAVMVAVFLGSLCYFFWNYLSFLAPVTRAVSAAILPLLSAGTLYALDRGNIDQLVMVAVLAFFALFARGRYGWSAFPLAAAIAMKAYPGALGVLLLLRRQYVAAALTALLTVVLTLGAAALYPGGLAGTYELWLERMAFLKSEYVANVVMHQGSLSYLSLVKIAARVARIDFAGHADPILLCYSAITAVIFTAVVAYVLIRERVLWKQVYLLTFLMLVLPQVSFDYKLIFLLLPVALFLNAPAGARREDLFYLGSFGLLLIPKAYFPLASETKVSGILNPLALTAMAAWIIWTGLRRPAMAGEGEESPCSTTGG